MTVFIYFTFAFAQVAHYCTCLMAEQSEQHLTDLQRTPPFVEITIFGKKKHFSDYASRLSIVKQNQYFILHVNFATVLSPQLINVIEPSHGSLFEKCLYQCEKLLFGS